MCETATHVSEDATENGTIRGLTGRVSDLVVAVPAAESAPALAASPAPADIDLVRMAEWAMHYLIHTPRPHLGYEPVFQCYPLQCPPVPSGHDVVVPCDTDARMDWEWYYMRDIAGTDVGRDVETAFHARMRSFVDDDGTVWSHVGCYNEGDIDHVYTDDDMVIHVWGATKILKSLSEDYLRNRNDESRALGRKVMHALRTLTSVDEHGHRWLPGGMGAIRRDGTPEPNSWNCHPAPLVESLVTFWRATGEAEALEFAREYADGIIHGAQPGGIRFRDDGAFLTPDGASPGHSHATMHALWGVADLGVALGEARYLEFVKKSWDWMRTRGTGTGWFPAQPDNCNETCCVSDMISNAVLIGRELAPEYYDYAERFFRNYIHNLQFTITPEFESYYRSLHADAPSEAVTRGLDALRPFQGGIVGASGVNDYENDLLHAHGFCMYGCCAPEGMRAIHTVWSHAIERRAATATRPGGVYVSMGLSRDSEWGRVVSFMPARGRLSVEAKVADTFFIRPPHWAPPGDVRAFVNSHPVPASWSSGYVQFAASPGDELTITYPLLRFTHEVDGLWSNCAPELEMRFEWLGNMVVAADPPAERTPLFTGAPRQLPPAPDF